MTSSKTATVKSDTQNRSPSPRKMTKEEIEKTSQRLIQRPPPPDIKDPIQLSPRILKDKEQIDKSVERLYTVAIDQKKRKLEESEKNQNKDVPKPVTRSAEEIEEGVSRLYSQSMEMQKQSREKSAQKYLHKPSSRPQQMTVEESTKRLYNESLQKQKDTEKELFDKYVAATAVKSKKLTAGELKASAERLTQKK